MTRQVSVGVAFRPTDQELLTLLRDRVESGSGHDNVEELPESINAIDPQSLLSPSGAKLLFAVVSGSARKVYFSIEPGQEAPALNPRFPPELDHL